MVWSEQLRLCLQNLGPNGKQWQRKTQISYQTNLDNFADKWTQSRQLALHTIAKARTHKNRNIEACINFVKCAIKKCLDNNDDINLPLSQMRSTPVGAGLPSPATLLFNRPIRAQLSQMNREPITFNADSEYHEALEHAKINTLRTVILAKTHFLSQ